ncbi:MAG: lipopolysaccharide heptosyltransferase I [Acidobacteria bacterium RIFCSPLOWO2_12_FULL_54_10]|nr:MAG: lipopolysaccharide heptosyltransferase I [Acidobacteria bacterium RIFCSPLOWO2_12_FULL_54_10]
MTALAPHRILIVRLGSMGDIVHALPVAATLKDNFPECEIDWLVERRWSPLLAGHPALRHVLQIDTFALRKDLLSASTCTEVNAILSELKSRRYDFALDLQGSIKSAMACSLSGSASIVGFDSPWLRELPAGLLYTKRVSPDAVHVVDANLALAQSLGAARPVTRFDLPLGNTDALPPELSHGRVAVLNPGAGWGSKCWSVEGYASVADALARDHDFRIVVNSGPGEENLAQQVLRACKTSHPLFFTGDIPALLALLRRSSLVIGSDTGPVHIAAALGIPTIALFGPTNPARNGPYGSNTRWLRSEHSLTSYSHSASPDESLLEIRPDAVLSLVREFFTSR